MSNWSQIIFADTPMTAVTARMRTNFDALLTQLPPVPGVIFEQKSMANPSSDISLRLSSADGSLAFFLAQLTNNAEFKAIHTVSIWQRIVQFLTVYQGYFDDCWLEFDDADLQRDLPIPSVFFNPKQHWLNNNIESFIKAISLLAGHPVSPDFSHRLLELTQHRATRLHYVGIMLARGEDSIRGCINMPFRELPKFVEFHQLPLSAQRIEQEIHPDIAEYLDNIVLSLDIADGIKPRIGIEFAVSEHDQVAHLYRCLHQSPLRTSINTDWDFAFWPGKSSQLTTALTSGRLSALAGDDKKIVYSRRINHFKIICDSASAPELKTYLYLALGWF